ncbi:leucine-rich repeat receptor-like serine/threonine-protein kinase at1g17230 [Phtheirospermum japonicum]|uniref:Leucine-rich repeat receptor-like serine/threonine-protein kinase at1g17230 n=1 Tax=Phtheirospermum japonicum TaxID=374723 RepID=A0A830CSJ9_9LAMI|nr:leucine-rich repeat receptor-like serine/threonine-protein kinase at1g17230 [Phtheirospermum japonicum]
MLFACIIVLVQSLNEEGATLLEFKMSLNDPFLNLQNWNYLDSNPCNWTGVLCSPHNHRVISLHLSGLNLSGTLSSTICKLPFLMKLVIHSNNLTGEIPSSVGRLKRLKIIRAGRNYLSGPLPVEVSECTNLAVLGLAENELEGPFPVELQKLDKLTSLILWNNQFFGEIPPEIGNFTGLELLALNGNKFAGPIPKEIGKLAKLKRLYLYTNQLNGTIPVELANCLNAVEIDLSENRLTGPIPKNLGRVSKLVLLYLFENHLQGNIPKELGRLKQLRKLDLSINNLTGSIPLDFQNLRFLKDFQLFNNHLNGKIPPLLGFNSKLSILDFSKNNLVGKIPENICWFQKLTVLSLGSNKLSGNVPYSLKTCKSLETLMLGDNLLTGTLSVEYTRLQNLSALELYQNRFSGLLPSEIGNFRNIERLLLSHNHFTGHLFGNIPQELGNCINLERLDLSGNWFSGFIPDALGLLVKLELLKISDNQFGGPIPGSLGGLVRLTELQMGGNYFSGLIPFELGQLGTLQIALNISHNNLTGLIPSSLGNLQMLESLYLNDNRLSGEIPNSIGGLRSLMECNFSNNNLVGPVPNTPTFQKMDSSNFVGNNGLCVLGSNRCRLLPSPSSRMKPSWLKVISLAFIAAVCWAMRRAGPDFASLEDRLKNDELDGYYFPKEGFSYHDLLEATGNFSETAVLGKGACGVVYKAVMADGEVIAVKKLNKPRGEGDNSFRAEISTLGTIRHRNIVKLYGFCYHQEGNLILYEYMANGSLGEVLRADKAASMLEWDARYKIALGAAEGLCYLHSDCKPQIIHRDIKSNNILLDEYFEAHVGDFGLAKLIDFSLSKSMSAVAGSYGYIAPEYAYTMKVTEKCDIYSFGVVLLELVTGKSPVQPLEQGGDLVTWARRSIQQSESASQLFDQRIDLGTKRTVEEMSLVLKIALFCTNSSPLNRPTMREVIAMLLDAREGVIASSAPSPTSETPLDADDFSRGTRSPPPATTHTKG